MEVEKRYCEVDLLGHCTFCQGKLTHGRISSGDNGGGDHNDGVDEDEEWSFDHIWTYLFKREWNGGHAVVKYVFKDMDASSVSVYQDVPPMCPCCEERIRELDKLHKGLVRKVEDVRKIVIAAARESGKKSKKRGGLGEILENSALESSVKLSTLQFLNELVKACNKFQFIDRHEVPNEDDEELEKEKNRSPSCKQSGSPSPNCLELLKDSLEDELMEVKEEPDSSDSQSISSSNYEDEVEDHRDNEITDFVNENSDSGGESEGSDDEDDAAAVSPIVGDAELTDESDVSDVESRKASSESISMEEGEDNEAAPSPSSQTESSVDSDESEEELSELPHKRKKQPNIEKATTQLKSHSHPVLKQRCDLCNQRIPFNEIRQHLEAQHNVQDYFSKCPNPKCKYIYSNRRSLETLHLFSSSGKKCREFTGLSPQQKKFDWFRKCERCDFRHETIRAFKSHLLFHENHQDLPKEFPCPIPECEERYALRQSLELHISEHGLKHKSYKKSAKTHQPCPICPGKPKLQVGADMTAHLKETHDAEEVLSCRQCPFVFPNREALLKHLSRHKIDGILCDICDDGVKYTSHIRVLRHYLSKHQIGHEFECEVCGKSFLYLNSLKSHQQVAHPELYPAPAPDKILKCKSPYGCPICKKPCITEKGLILHKIKAHGADNGPLKCQICERVYSDFSMLAEHMESHGGIQFKCSEQNCDKIYSTRRMLRKHTLLVHVVGKKACEICGKRFANTTSLQRHTQNIHQGQKHLCSTCGIQYRTGYGLEVHMRTHTGLKPYQCPKCGLRFHEKNQFKYHVKKPTCDFPKVRRAPRKNNATKTEAIQVPLNCEFCDELYDTGKGLRNHIRSAHDMETKGCKTCGKKFASKHTLRRHMEDVHLGRKYLCSVCGAELSSVNSLALHMKLHTGDTLEGDGEGGGARAKTLKCNIEGCHDQFPTMKELFDHRKVFHGGWGKLVCESCGKSFTTEKYLRLHNKRYHLGLLETFHCDICGKSSSSRTTLKNHRMTHTGERPLSCHLCGQPFRTDPALKKHLKRHEEQGDKFQPRGAFKTYKGRPC